MYESYDQRHCPFQAAPIYTEGIPRSHYYPSSDGSEAGSPRGGGSAGSGGSISFPSTHQQSQHERSQQDTPFHPSHTIAQPPSSLGFVLPPEYQLASSFVSVVGIRRCLLLTFKPLKVQRHSRVQRRHSVGQTNSAVWPVPRYRPAPSYRTGTAPTRVCAVAAGWLASSAFPPSPSVP
ncbi:hypothetical protein AX15_003823 [Amanita polypyramis BW_CC]|nr:hypothetical protein AX15_003823 [Amanita polypyramis BW_CC]